MKALQKKPESRGEFTIEEIIGVYNKASPKKPL